MSDKPLPIDLSKVEESALWKEISLRHRTVVMVVMDDDLSGNQGEGKESKDMWWSGGHTNALGLLVWGKEDILGRIDRTVHTEAEGD